MHNKRMLSGKWKDFYIHPINQDILFFLVVRKTEWRGELQSVEAEVNEKYGRKKKERNSPTVTEPRL